MAQGQAKENASQKIAFIDTRMFADEKEGILAYVKAINDLNREFEPIIEELKTFVARVEKLSKEIEKAKAATSPDVELIKEKQAELDRMSRELSPFDSLSSYRKRESVLLKPIEEDISKELKIFVKQTEITILINLGDDVPFCGFCPSCPDITKEFIVYYNSKHPVTNSQTQVKLSEPK